MKAAIMQPYFFPYLGYYALISDADSWVIFDTPQFIRHGWIDRNRIISQSGEAFYIKVPLVKHKRDTPIKDVAIRNNENWKTKITEQLKHYKRRSPFYVETMEVVNESLSINTNSIVELNDFILKITCTYLGIDYASRFFSNMILKRDTTLEADEWALEICKHIDADQYINPIGGAEFFQKEKYDKANIELKFIDFHIKEYKQMDGAFVPGLSIIDVMMFNHPNEIREMLGNYSFE